ncbi:MAG: hypothetical protein ACR2NU_16935 [Aeoliella sp.]
MLWPFILPFKITLGVFSLLLATVTVLAPAFRWKRTHAVFGGTVIAMLAFIPSCSVITYGLDQYRFGVFSYADFDSVNDFRVERFLPEPATDITVKKYAQGYQARFKIDKQSLDDWFDQHWDRYSEYSVTPREEIIGARTLSANVFDREFEGLGWSPPTNVIDYEGPSAANGAGFTLWYSESDGIAYQRGGYW